MAGSEENDRAPRLLPQGDTGLVVEYGDAIDPASARRARGLADALRARAVPGIVDLAPTLRSLLVHYDPLAISQAALAEIVAPLAARAARAGAPPDRGRRWRLPACYEGACAPDLPGVARAAGMAEAEVARLHAATEMEVLAMGFLPGFPYLGLLPEAFDLPRLAEPRVRVPPGSISVAARQTTVYTVPSPGGWRLIGRTPADLYDPDRADPILLRPGDRVRFEPVPAARYAEVRAAFRADPAAWREDGA